MTLILKKLRGIANGTRRFSAHAVMLLVAFTISCGGGDGSTQSEMLAQVASLEDKVDQLEQQLAAANAAHALDGTTIANLMSELEQVRAQLAALQSGINDPDPQLAVLMQQIANLQGQLATVQAIVDGLDGTLTLNLPFLFNGQSITRNKPYPLSSGNDQVAFDQIRYWLSNVELLRPNGTSFLVPASYYLIEMRGHQESSDLTATPQPLPDLPNDRRDRVVIHQIPAGVYSGIRFHIGIDPARNDNFANYAGELQVLQNMIDTAWMWLTSYVFTKTRATVTSGGKNIAVSWDNGTNADYREVVEQFGQTIALSGTHNWTVEVDAEVSHLFSAISAVKKPSIGAGNKADRATLADAFRGMFSFAQVATTTP